MCGGTAFETVCAYDRPDCYETAVGIGPEGYDRRWVRCRGCGFYASHYSRAPESLDRLYERAYRDAASAWRSGTTEEIFLRVAALPDDQSETRPRVRWIKNTLADLGQAGFFTPGRPPFRMLDIGGATGIFAYEFQRDDPDWRAHVVDPAEDGCFIETRLGIPYCRDPYRPGLFPEPFHLISLIFVLEHLLDPVAVLEAVRRDLAPNGALYVEVPDASAFRFKPTTDEIFNSCHLWMFDPTSLNRLLERCGFETLALRRIQTVRGHYALIALAGVR